MISLRRPFDLLENMKKYKKMEKIKSDPNDDEKS